MSMENAKVFVEKISTDPEIKKLFGTFTLEELEAVVKELSQKALARNADGCSYHLCGSSN